MDGFHDGGGLPAAAGDARRFLRWSKAAAEAVVRRTAGGEALRAICRDPEMPAMRTVTDWLKTRPQFAQAMAEARAQAGRSLRGRTTTYCRETAEVVFERLCAGDALIDIGRDPDMPAPSTLYKWMREQDEFRDAVALAREIQGDALAAEARAVARAVTPASARADEVRLRHMRWDAAKMAPRQYGTVGPTPAWAASGEAGPPEPRPKTKVITLKTFWLEAGPDGQTRVRERWYEPGLGEIVEDVSGDWGPEPENAPWPGGG